jgi:hypothetical protein
MGGMSHPTPKTDPRLQRRYQHMVQEHLGHGHRVAAGPRALPGPASAFAATQAVWRFCNNPRLNLPTLAEPLLACARQAVADACQDYALVAHDWSNLDYRSHSRKKDRIVLGSTAMIGYELRSALLISDRDGQALAPVCQDLRAAAGVYSSRHDEVQANQSCLDELAPVLAYLDDQHLGLPLVHLIDREADSVAHYRQWHAGGHFFLVRADDTRIVRHEGQERTLAEVVRQLEQGQAFRDVRAVDYHGKPARQWVAETAVALERPACLNRTVNGKKRRTKVSGPPLPLRLIVSRVVDAQGQVLAVWLLQTNVPASVEAATIALWYYWRWRIESYFKLLKGAGQQLEQWQQRTGLALARRLLVAGMACVLIWQLARSPAPEAATLRSLLVRLSGRQMKWGVAYTEPALLAGLWVLLALLEVAQQHDLAELQGLAQFVLAGSKSPDTS